MELTRWNFDNAEIRTLEIEGEPWFVGKDVASVLGYKDTSDALKKHVDTDDKLTRRFADSGQSREMYIINESGVYALIFGSKLPDAQRFKKWVTSEVLPTIRKHGAYMTPDTLQSAIANPDFAIGLLQQLKAEQEKRKSLETTVAVQAQQIAEYTPKVNYCDVVLNCKDLISISKIAKDYGKSAKWMNDFLHDNGVQYKQGSVWLLYQKYAGNGYTSTKTHTYLGTNGDIHSNVQTYWTQKGRLFIYDLMKSNGLFPMIERKRPADGDGQ